MLEKLIAKSIANRITNHEKIKKARALKKFKKRKYNMNMIKMFGKARYILSIWLGQWVLFTCNTKFYSVQEKKIADSTQQPSKVLYLLNYR